MGCGVVSIASMVNYILLKYQMIICIWGAVKSLQRQEVAESMHLTLSYTKTENTLHPSLRYSLAPSMPHLLGFRYSSLVPDYSAIHL